ncbi:MAG: metallophosphoesterase [Lachnospiraceae bacterium]|nr:metallophosphoesterase [Lachnospiraceae bacterium]
MKITVNYIKKHYADGTYTVNASGYNHATLYWADDNGILDDYTAFAVIPLSDGYGEFRYIGNRAIPLQATNIIARVTDEKSGNTEEIRADIPQSQKADMGNCLYRISLLSDLHLSNKTGKIMRALKLASESDCILVAGDSVNDGTAEQLKLFRECVNTVVPNTFPLFSVGGNHDFSIKEEESDFDYWDLHNIFLERNKNLGFNTGIHESGCWSAENDDIHIFGWKCVDENRNFFFGKKKEQLEFLADRLEKNKDKKYQIVCSHAPLIAHNPQRKPDGQPYFDGDRNLQELIDSYNNIIFVSGHTHFSPNDYMGCVDFDEERNNIYINDGSVCPTTYKSGEANFPKEWTDGVVTELAIYAGGVEITSRLLHGNKNISRGYYRFMK